MYGLVNQAIQELIVENFGAEAYGEIAEKAGVQISEFVAMESYDDSVTYALVGAASEVLGKPADELLEVFGRYWTEFVAQRGYGDFLKLSGRSLEEFPLQSRRYAHPHRADLPRARSSVLSV